MSAKAYDIASKGMGSKCVQVNDKQCQFNWSCRTSCTVEEVLAWPAGLSG